MATRTEQLALRTEALDLIRVRLQGLGLQGKTWLYSWNLSPEFEGRVILVVYMFPSEALVDIDPNVGIRSRTVERLLRELIPTTKRYATIQTPLSNLVPVDHLIARRSSWGFQPFLDKPRIADHFVHELREHGLPWAEANASLTGIIDEPRFGLASGHDPSAAIVRWLLGGNAGAREEVEASIDAAPAGAVAYRERMRQFSMNLGRRMGAGPPPALER